jgi:fructose-1,6-bisphosphatase/inositol monophosphatase family enzyme
VTDAVALTALAAHLAVSAGTMVRTGRRHGVSDVHTKSTATDMVTEFDRASERLIVAGVLDERPDDSIVGEEGTARQGSSEVSWLIDPIDGTTNFLYDLPGWSVSIAAATPEGTQAAAVYVPATEELFTATAGGGAWLNGAPIAPSPNSELATALVATGFSYLAERRLVQARRLVTLLPRIRDLRRSGSAAVDLCSVAAGRVDAYFEHHLGPWDLAAGELIARQAGCTVSATDGGPSTPESVLACTPALHSAMLELLAAGEP